MKEIIVGLMKSILPLLKAKTVLYVTMVLAIAFWVGHLFPQVFSFFKLDAWRAENESLIGSATIIATITFVIFLLLLFDSFVLSKLIRVRERRFVNNLFRELSTPELLYLFQFVRNNTTAIEFNRTDPTVGLLCEKGIISQSHSVLTGDAVQFRTSYFNGEVYEIHPSTFQYLKEHLSLFDKLA
jgi:hypothetical protein